MFPPKPSLVAYRGKAGAEWQPTWVYRERELFRSAALPIYAHVGLYGGDVEYNDAAPHGHDFLEIGVIGSGSGQHVTANGSHEIGPGSVLVSRPSAWHAYVHCRELILANTCISARAAQGDLALLRDDQGFRDLLWTGPQASGRHGVLETRISAQDAEEVVDEVQQLQDRLEKRSDDRVVLLGQLLTVLGLIVSGTATKTRSYSTHPAISAVLAQLDAAPEHPWHVEELAQIVNLDPAYLTRLFRRHTGLPPIAYLARIRIEKAASLLAGTTLSIAKIGALVGWPDHRYFARRFHDLVGITPTAYRRHNMQHAAEVHQIHSPEQLSATAGGHSLLPLHLGFGCDNKVGGPRQACLAGRVKVGIVRLFIRIGPCLN